MGLYVSTDLWILLHRSQPGGRPSQHPATESTAHQAVGAALQGLNSGSAPAHTFSTLLLGAVHHHGLALLHNLVRRQSNLRSTLPELPHSPHTQTGLGKPHTLLACTLNKQTQQPNQANSIQPRGSESVVVQPQTQQSFLLATLHMVSSYWHGPNAITP